MQTEVGFDKTREWKYGIGFYDFRAFLCENFFHVIITWFWIKQISILKMLGELYQWYEYSVVIILYNLFLQQSCIVINTCYIDNILWGCDSIGWFFPYLEIKRNLFDFFTIITLPNDVPRFPHFLLYNTRNNSHKFRYPLLTSVLDLSISSPWKFIEA